MIKKVENDIRTYLSDILKSGHGEKYPRIQLRTVKEK